MNRSHHPSLPLLTFFGISLLVFVPWVSVAQAQDFPPEVLRYADMVLYNGQVLTMDREQPPINVVEAMAIRDGRILAAGRDERILQMAGPDTTRVDLAGKAVIPGVVDTHSHPNSYALRHYRQEYASAYVNFLEENKVRLATVRWETKETALSDFKLVAENTPADYWIYATGGLIPTTMDQVTRYDLDQVAPDHPLYVMMGNAMWGLANTKMLEIIRDRYGDTLPGLIRDEQGVLTGQIYGPAGTVVDQEVIPQAPPQILAPLFKRELEEWVAMGVTTLSTRLSGNEVTAYGQLDREGQLPLRLGYSHEIGRGNPFLERDLKRFGNLQGHGTDWMWMIGISVGIPDGSGPGASAGGGTDCSSMPKREMLQGDYWPTGVCFWETPGFMGAEGVLVANRYGYRVAGVHTFGDKAYLMLLDAYEQANQESSILDQRFGLDHGMMVSPEIIEKSAKMGAIWSLQPPLFYGRYAATISRVYGEEYAHRWVLPVKSLIDAGVKVSYGADSHTDPDRQPLHNLEVLVTRRVKDGRIFGSREAIDRATALLMMTRWGGRYVLREEELGSIEAGKLADLVVLAQNPLDQDVADEDLSEIEILATLIDGEVRYGSLEW